MMNAKNNSAPKKTGINCMMIYLYSVFVFFTFVLTR